MPTHKQNIEAVTVQKVVGVSGGEALAAASSLRQLAEDAETASDVKGAATLFSRQLMQNAGNGPAREELMRKANALAGRA
jgi:hypothetical protein